MSLLTKETLLTKKQSYSMTNIFYARRVLSQAGVSEENIMLAIELAARDLSPRNLELCILYLRLRQEINIAAAADENTDLENAFERAHARISREISIDEMYEGTEDETDRETEEDEMDRETDEVEKEVEKERVTEIYLNEEPVVRSKVVRAKVKSKAKVPARTQETAVGEIAEPKSKANVPVKVEPVVAEPQPKIAPKTKGRKLPPNTAKSNDLPKWMKSAKPKPEGPEINEGKSNEGKSNEGKSNEGKSNECILYSFIEKIKAHGREAGYIHENGSDSFYIDEETFSLSKNSTSGISTTHVKANIHYDSSVDSWIATDIILS